jgi:hypothetical protein
MPRPIALSNYTTNGEKPMITLIGFFALALLLSCAALAIALTVMSWKAWAEAQFRTFDSSLDHVTEE